MLLHAIARLIAERAGWRVRAAHVDHGLHVDSGRWAEHCRRQAEALEVEFAAHVVAVSRSADASLEAAARDARYSALRGDLRPGELLLTAHHADDQLETMLLALMRGAGLRGVSSMPAMQPFGRGSLVRPLLEFSRAELAQWAAEEGLSWLDDPANESVEFDRNFLRQRVVPILCERWPAAAHSASRSAAHLLEANKLVDRLAASDAEAVANGAQLVVDRLRALDSARRRNVLRYWIRRCGGRAPSTRKLAAIEGTMLGARGDRMPRVEWDGMEVRRYGGELYCMAALPPAPAPDAIDWDWSAPLDLPAPLGRLGLEAAAAGIAAGRLAQRLQVRFRAGGEAVRRAGDAHHRKLKKLLQSARVLPWWRGRLPLIYSGGALVAIGDLWIAEEFAARAGEEALRVVWEKKGSPHDRHPTKSR